MFSEADINVVFSRFVVTRETRKIRKLITKSLLPTYKKLSISYSFELLLLPFVLIY